MAGPKLLLTFESVTLLERALSTAFSSEAESVLVVTGAWHDEMLPFIPASGVTILFNPQWGEGQSSSVARAASYCEADGFDALILMVADQPFIGADHLNALIEAYRRGSMDICVSAVEGRRGNPCLFDARCFSALQELGGDEGARQLLRGDTDYLVHAVDFKDPRLFEDIDSPEDYQHLVRGIQGAI
jgi:molybdenum cofactor cytidylyltransferase